MFFLTLLYTMIDVKEINNNNNNNNNNASAKQKKVMQI